MSQERIIYAVLTCASLAWVFWIAWIAEGRDALHRWLDRRGRIPRWVRWIYPSAHFCDALDYALVLDLTHCACELRNGAHDHEPTNERKPF